MDRVIARESSVKIDNGLRWCESLAIAFQADMSRPIEYGEEYWKYYWSLENSPAAANLTRRRFWMSHRVGGLVLDIGIGSGKFLCECEASGRPLLGGYDVNPHAVAWLCDRNLYFDPYDPGRQSLPSEPVTWTLWDVIEHLPRPHELLDRIRVGDALCLTVPIYHDLLREIPSSKHFKPNEHFYYFTPAGLIRWLAAYGFELLEMNRDEQLAGRESVASFAFRKRG